MYKYFEMITQEIQIPVPWGYIAAKAWGDPKNPPVFALHGWSDNANSFDRLIPLLPKCYYYICIDLPSHGKSSPLNATIFVHILDFVMIYKFLYDYVKTKLIILAHSLSGMTATLFTQFYPECVSKIMILDIFHFFPISPKESIKIWQIVMKRRYTSLTKFNNKPLVLTKEQHIRRIMGNRLTPLSREAAEIIAERNLKLVQDDKYVSTIPYYIKNMLFGTYNLEGLLEIVKYYPIRCPHLIILPTTFLKLAFNNIYKEYKKNNNFEFHTVNGTHEVHLENPERIAPVITQFLNKHNSKL